MFGKFLNYFFVSLVVILGGCAKPTYVVSSKDKILQGSEGQKENKLGCSTQFKVAGVCLTWYWEEKPTESVAGSLVFKAYRLNLLDQTPIELDMASVPQVVLWMPSMGHGSVPTQTIRVDTGTYRATNVFFIMPGEWEIKFQIKEGTLVQDEAVVAITI